MGAMKYPLYRDELLAMLAQDQEEIRAQSKVYKHAPTAASTLSDRERLAARRIERAERVLAILGEIKEPTIDTIGADGSQAVSVLAAHSRLSIMEKILHTFECCYRTDPNSVYHEAIPSLTDWVRVLEKKEQEFGTRWMVGSDGNPFLPPVRDFKNMNKRRAAHGLGRARQPRDLTYGVPNGPLPPETQEEDQRKPTQTEFDDNTKGFFD